MRFLTAFSFCFLLLSAPALATEKADSSCYSSEASELLGQKIKQENQGDIENIYPFYLEQILLFEKQNPDIHFYNFKQNFLNEIYGYDRGTECAFSTINFAIFMQASYFICENPQLTAAEAVQKAILFGIENKWANKEPHTESLINNYNE